MAMIVCMLHSDMEPLQLYLNHAQSLLFGTYLHFLHTPGSTQQSRQHR